MSIDTLYINNFSSVLTQAWDDQQAINWPAEALNELAINTDPANPDNAQYLVTLVNPVNVVVAVYRIHWQGGINFTHALEWSNVGFLYQTWPIGTKIELRISAEMLREFKAGVNAASALSATVTAMQSDISGLLDRILVDQSGNVLTAGGNVLSA